MPSIMHFSIIIAHSVPPEPRATTELTADPHYLSYPTGELFTDRTAAFREFLKRYTETHPGMSEDDILNTNLYACTDVCFEARLRSRVLFIMSIRPIKLDLSLVG